jgi:hypothetical protein
MVDKTKHNNLKHKGENIMENINITNNELPVEMPFFVGYHMAENGIGKAMIKEWNEDSVTMALCGDDGVYEDFFVISKERFNDSMEYLRYVVQKIGMENIVSE